MSKELRINGQRLLRNLSELATIGATADGGVTRLAFSEADIHGRQWFEQKAKSIQLDYATDGAANQSAVLRSTQPHAKTLMIGSHIDTVTNGGRFDGALGVLAALEAAQIIKEAGITLSFHLEVISFTDEEGTHFGEFGSHALTGALKTEDIENPRSSREQLAEGMARLEITAESALGAKRDPAQILGFFELHIEQGIRLEKQSLDIGIVTAIVGIRSVWLTFEGKANHAGTTEMDRRQNALWGAAEFVLQARDLIIEKYHPGVINCGQLNASPAAFNIIPDHARFSLEFRHGSESLLDQMAHDLQKLAKTIATKYKLSLTWQNAPACIAAPAAENMLLALETAANTLELSHQRMMSFAGHDAQMMSYFVPSAMFFVPSKDGISHNPNEFTQDQDVINGGNMILQAVLAMESTERGR